MQNQLFIIAARCVHLWPFNDSFQTVKVRSIADWFTRVFHQRPSCLQHQQH